MRIEINLLTIQNNSINEIHNSNELTTNQSFKQNI